MTTVVRLEDAQQHVWGRLRVLPSVIADLSDAVGAVIARDVIAGEPVPPFANSAVDGWAVRAEDVAKVPVRLTILGEIAAGATSGIEVVSGGALKIMTGAPIPAGADAVVMVEDSESDDSTVLIKASVKHGSAVRNAGSDVKLGQLVYKAGTVINPAVAGVLASINCNQVEIVRRARVAVLSTGDELVDDGSPLQPGQIRESNKVMLLKLVEAAGATPVDFGIVRDDEEKLESVLREAADTCDAIITSGGVSMGDYDVVKAVLSRIAEMAWMQIAIRPAKPFAFGEITNSIGAKIPVYGLPGNPVSSMVSFELLARPALRAMMALPAMRPRVLAMVEEDLRREPDGKTHWVRVFAHFDDDGFVHVSATGPQGSHQLASTSGANALAAVEDGFGVFAGDRVEVMILTDWF